MCLHRADLPLTPYFVVVVVVVVVVFWTTWPALPIASCFVMCGTDALQQESICGSETCSAHCRDNMNISLSFTKPQPIEECQCSGGRFAMAI